MSERLSDRLHALLAVNEPAVIVTVARARGSTPREAGACMIVTRRGSHGTIGGGRLEWEAQQRARAMIAGGPDVDSLDMPLGPAVGQCCGGHVVLELRRADRAMAAGLAAAEAVEAQDRPQVIVCGGGHVGTALAQALAPLPVRLSWVDARPDVAAAAQCTLGDPVECVVEAQAGAAVVVTTHSHDLDFRVSEAALRRGDLSYVGLIGSTTKRRRFERWFAARGGDGRQLSRLTCPIGDVGIVDKRPAVIAALTVAEVLQALGRSGALTGHAGQPPQQKAAGR